MFGRYGAEHPRSQAAWGEGGAGTLNTDHCEGSGLAGRGQPATPWWSAHNAFLAVKLRETLW